MLAVSKPSRLLFTMLCTALLTLALPTGSALADRGDGHKYAKLSDYVKKASLSRPGKHAKRSHGRKHASLSRSARQNQHEVCQDLKGGTRGLYGLCVAYCESQSCDTKSAEAGLCMQQRFNLRVLENYNRLKAVGDPDMPCLNNDTPDEAVDEVVDEVVATPSPCPCVSEQEVDETQWSSCEIESGASVVTGDAGTTVLRFDPNPYATSCSLTSQDIDREFPLDEQQASACSTMVEMATERNDIGCADPSAEVVDNNF